MNRIIADYEQTLIGALQSEIRVGDSVTIVGGGEGVTAVVAAQAVGETGSVVCFEGSGWGVRKVKATGIRNKMSKPLTVKHAVVGEAINVYGDPGDLSALVVAPAERHAETCLGRTNLPGTSRFRSSLSRGFARVQRSALSDRWRKADFHCLQRPRPARHRGVHGYLE